MTDCSLEPRPECGPIDIVTNCNLSVQGTTIFWFALNNVNSPTVSFRLFRDDALLLEQDLTPSYSVAEFCGETCRSASVTLDIP